MRALTAARGDNQPHVSLCRFSVSNDLKYDAERDLKDIEASHIPVHALNKVGRGVVMVFWGTGAADGPASARRVAERSSCLRTAGGPGTADHELPALPLRSLLSACSSRSGLVLCWQALQSRMVSAELLPAAARSAKDSRT